MDCNHWDQACHHASQAISIYEVYEAPVLIKFLNSKFSCLLHGNSELQHLPGKDTPDTITVAFLEST
jgi:hypothetical protein